jgi:hypothetical protein
MENLQAGEKVKDNAFGKLLAPLRCSAWSNTEENQDEQYDDEERSGVHACASLCASLKDKPSPAGVN